MNAETSNYSEIVFSKILTAMISAFAVDTKQYIPPVDIQHTPCVC